jgi:hypothetical protein
MFTRGIKRKQDNMEDDGALMEGTINELESVIALFEVYPIRFIFAAVDVDNFDVAGTRRIFCKFGNKCWYGKE